MLFVIFAHFLASITPGPASLYALNVLFKTNLDSAKKVIIGITLGNATYIVLSLLGLSILQTSNLAFIVVLNSICILILLYLGFKNIIAFFKQKKISVHPNNTKKYLLSGFSITIFNPKAILLYPVVFAPTITKYTPIQKIVTASYFILATFVFLSIIIYLANFGKQKFVKSLRYSQIIFGFAMIFFAGLVYVRTIKLFTAFN